MRLTKPQKVDLCRQLAGKFKSAPLLYFTRYQGLKFVELHRLRVKLRPHGGYQVMKNTLVANALKAAGIGGAAPDLLRGPVGLVVGDAQGDPVAAVKILAAFAKEFPFLKVSAGYIEGRWLDAADCAFFATLGSRPEMLSSLAGTLMGLLARGAGLFQAPLGQFAGLLKALHDKRAGESGAPAPAAVAGA